VSQGGGATANLPLGAYFPRTPAIQLSHANRSAADRQAKLKRRLLTRGQGRSTRPTDDINSRPPATTTRDTGNCSTSEPTLDELMATFGSPARGRVDLLTTVMHELGHVLGLDHADGSGLMNALLPLSTRRLLDDDILPIWERENVADSWDPVDDLFRSLGQGV